MARFCHDLNSVCCLQVSNTSRKWLKLLEFLERPRKHDTIVGLKQHVFFSVGKLVFFCKDPPRAALKGALFECHRG